MIRRMSPLQIVCGLKEELGKRNLYLGAYETFGQKRKIVRCLVVTVRNPWPRISDYAVLLFDEIPTVINGQMIFRPKTQDIFRLNVLPPSEMDIGGISSDLINAAFLRMDDYTEKLLGSRQ